jgi:phage tail sheath protein FI
VATYKRPGTYVEEVTLAQQVSNVSSGPAVAAFLGTSPQGPATATLISSWSEFVRLYGTFNATDLLHFAVYQYFANGGKQAYIARVVPSSGSAAATVSIKDRAGTPVNTLSITALNAGKWGNSLSVDIFDSPDGTRFDLVLYNNGIQVERYNDLSMDANDARHVVRQINTNSDYVVVADLASATTAPNNRPGLTSGTPAALSGGTYTTDATPSDLTNSVTYGNAGAKFDNIDASIILNCTEAGRQSSANAGTILGAASDYAYLRGDTFVVADVPTAVVAGALSGVTTFIAAIATGSTATGNTDQNVAAYFPWLTIQDPLGSPGVTRDVPPGGAVIGLIATTDASRGVYKAPAGTSISLNVLQPSKVLPPADLDTLRSYKVNAIKPVIGSGTVVYGAQTLDGSYPNRNINARRTVIYLKRALTQATGFAVFENNDDRLWNSLRTVCSTILNDLWQQGGLAGQNADQAYYVKCDRTNNTDQDIAQGRVNVEVGVALQTPAEFVVIKIGQFQGGASVSGQ